MRSTRVSVPVISVGNISAGGTGKTPFVLFLADLLKQSGKRPAILSRGYGRSSSGFQVVSNGRQQCAEATTAGDEPALLAGKLQGVPVAVDERRVRGAQKLIELFSPDVIVLDDGFQHRSLRRDCDVVLLTADELMKPSFLLPAGYRREPLSSLQRANVIVISKCRDADHFRQAAVKLGNRFRARVFGVRTVAEGAMRHRLDGSTEEASLRGRKVVAFSGIADGSSFDRTLDELGVELLVHHRYADHHWYTTTDLRRIGDTFRTLNAEAIVTTEKDLVRIRTGSDFVGRFPLFSVAVRLEVVADETDLKNTLGEIVGWKGA